QGREIGLLVLVHRRGHGHDVNVAAGDLPQLTGEAQPLRARNQPGLDFSGPVPTSKQLFDPLGADVIADGTVLLAELHRQRQANVTQAYHGDAGGVGLGLMLYVGVSYRRTWRGACARYKTCRMIVRAPIAVMRQFQVGPRAYAGRRFAYASTSHLLPTSSKLTCTRAWAPEPSMSVTMPGPNLAWVTPWPMLMPGFSSITAWPRRGAEASGRETPTRGRTSCSSSPGISRRNRDGMPYMSWPCRRRDSA